MDGKLLAKARERLAETREQNRREELRRRTELLNRQEDNNRATAARLLGKE